MSKIAVIGLGYVGLPLAVALQLRGHEVTGIDIQKSKVDRIRKGDDPSCEVDKATLLKANLTLATEFAAVAEVEFIIIAVPTPINDSKQPDLRPLEGASRSIAPYLKNRCVVIYESTVYPGVTELVCLPILEASGKVRGKDFRLAYSPERINPGDKKHTIHTVVKVVSGEDEETLEAVAKLYESVVDAGVHRAESIMVAEAAKVIENTQRDLNIALMNELALIFDRMGIRTAQVLKAAGSKWNFLPFFPGLVGGHCIGVDPYYLTYRAQALGYTPQVITAGRRINDGMGKFIAEKTVKKLIRNGDTVSGARVLILGLTFKENVPDFRNSRVVDIIGELKEYYVQVEAHDPFAVNGDHLHEFNLPVVELKEIKGVDAIILAVSHQEYTQLGIEELKSLYAPGRKPILVDVKGIYRDLHLEDHGFDYWEL